MTSDVLTNLYEWIQTVTPEMMPPAPIMLAPGVTVLNAHTWLRSLQQEALKGPRGPRSLRGALQQDLRMLFGLMEGNTHAEKKVSRGSGTSSLEGMGCGQEEDVACSANRDGEDDSILKDN